MRRDPTQFRKRFNEWKAGGKVYEAGLPTYADGKESEDPIVYDTYKPEIVVTPNKPLHFSGHTYSEAWNQDTKDRKVLNSFKPSATGPLMRGAVPFFAPLMIPSLAAGMAAIAPGTAGGTMVGQAAASMGAGELLNKASEIVTGNSFGQNVSDLTGGYVSPELGDFVNPGYWSGGRYLTKGIQETLNLIKQGQNWANRNYVQPYNLYREMGKTTPVLEELNPTVRFKLGDVEINNPNLFYRQDNPSSGAFDHANSYVENGILFPGQSSMEGQANYSWWNKGKPYLTINYPERPIGGINGVEMPRLFTAGESDAPFIHVKSQSYPIGQWNGKRGFIQQSEYVSPEAVDVSNSTYMYEPNYGYRKVVQQPSTIDFNTARAATHSELDWSDWLNTRHKGASITKEEIQELNENIPQLINLEKEAKANGTWLKNSDGTDWEGAINPKTGQLDKDPRRWLMEQFLRKKNKITGEPIYSGVPEAYLSTYDSYMNSMKETWGATQPEGPRIYTRPDGQPIIVNQNENISEGALSELYLNNKANLSPIIKVDNVKNQPGALWGTSYPEEVSKYTFDFDFAKGRTPYPKVLTDDYVSLMKHKGYNVTRLNGVIDSGPYDIPMDERIIHKGTPRISIWGNTGRGINMYRSLLLPAAITTGIGLSAASLKK